MFLRISEKWTTSANCAVSRSNRNQWDRSNIPAVSNIDRELAIVTFVVDIRNRREGVANHHGKRSKPSARISSSTSSIEWTDERDIVQWESGKIRHQISRIPLTYIYSRCNFSLRCSCSCCPVPWLFKLATSRCEYQEGCWKQRRIYPGHREREGLEELFQFPLARIESWFASKLWLEDSFQILSFQDGRARYWTNNVLQYSAKQ